MTRPVPTVVPPMVIGIENPLAASLIAAIRYLYEGLSMSWEAANYKIPEQNALNVLRAQYALDRSCVITALADAGVGKQPEDLLKTA